jgi:hypothetical protein
MTSMLKLAWYCPVLLLVVVGLKWAINPVYASALGAQHQECVKVAQGYLPEMSIKNVCEEPIDLKWCHMTRANTNIGCEVVPDMGPQHFVTTGACAGCVWKVNYEVFLSSENASGEFSSDAYMLADLRRH